MEFRASDFVKFLQSRGVVNIFHANTVTTSCSLLRLGALCSRKYVIDSNFLQTDQASDELDVKFDIFDSVFFDTCDIHSSVHDRNNYGPVLFEASVNILLRSSCGVVKITKHNPTKWDSIAPNERWFSSISELNQKFEIGNFDQMLAACRT